MSGPRRALIAERAFGKEQAQQWLYRDPVAEFSQADLVAWRATCYHDSVQEHEHNEDAARLLLEWEAAFDATINDVRDMADGSVTRAVVLVDMWSGAGFEGPSILMARAGDFVVSQPSFIDQYPLTIIPRTGQPFCASLAEIRVFERINFAESGVVVGAGECNA